MCNWPEPRRLMALREVFGAWETGGSEFAPDEGMGGGRRGASFRGMVDGEEARRQTKSLSAFRGTALITFRAGFALMVIGSLVKGLMPCFALVAGLRTTRSFRRLGTTK